MKTGATFFDAVLKTCVPIFELVEQHIATAVKVFRCASRLDLCTDYITRKFHPFCHASSSGGCYTTKDASSSTVAFAVDVIR